MVEVACDILMFKVKHESWVDGLSKDACLEVKVGTVGTSCVAAESDGLARSYHLVFYHKMFAEVSI